VAAALPADEFPPVGTISMPLKARDVHTYPPIRLEKENQGEKVQREASPFVQCSKPPTTKVYFQPRALKDKGWAVRASRRMRDPGRASAEWA